jgi:hypothetical protein
MSEYEQALLAAVQAELGSPPPTKYPYPCGCHGPKYISKCTKHQMEQVKEDARRQGVADLRFTHRDFTNLPQLVETLHAIKLHLISNPTKPCVIKINPEQRDEANASGASRPDEAAVPNPGVAKA